jgi:hypothetical protein
LKEWEVEYTDEFGTWWQALIAGDKTGRDDFYEFYVPRADLLYDDHLAEIGQA